MSHNYKAIQAGRSLDARPRLLANAVERACRRRRWGQVTLARHAGVPLLAVQRVWRGVSKQPSFWTVARLAKALQLDLNYLAGLAPEQKGRAHGTYTTFL